MDLKQLRYFHTIVEEGSFSAAARRCGVAQPSLSQQVQNLESELGEVLLKRSPRGATPTEAGELLFERAGRVLAEGEALLDTFRDRGAALGGKVNFGVIPTVAPSLLGEVLSTFREEDRNVEVNVREVQTSDLVRMVVDEEVEFAVVSDIEPAVRKKLSLHVKTLFREPILLAVGSKHPLARRRTADVAQLDTAEVLSLSEGHCLRDQTPAICRPKDIVQPTHCEQLPTLLGLVSAGMGIAFVPEMFAQRNTASGVTYLKLRNPEPFRAINLMKRRGRKLSPAADRLLKLIAEW